MQNRSVEQGIETGIPAGGGAMDRRICVAPMMDWTDDV